MDRSYLSNQEVVEASRDFVCIRLATYENAAEAKILKDIFTGRSGELENTTFVVLGPDGKRRHSRSGRSPRHAYDSVEAMVRSLRRVSERYKQRSRKPKPTLPAMESFRLSLNVAACDSLPNVVVIGDKKARAGIEKKLASLAWHKELQGQFVFGRAETREELEVVDGLPMKAAVAVIQPDRFGLKGKVLAHVSANASVKDLEKALREGLAKHEIYSKDTRRHRSQGRRAGARWETKIPVTDPGRPPRRGGGR